MGKKISTTLGVVILLVVAAVAAYVLIRATSAPRGMERPVGMREQRAGPTGERRPQRGPRRPAGGERRGRRGAPAPATAPSGR